MSYIFNIIYNTINRLNDPTIYIIYRYMYVCKINGMIESDRMSELPFYSP